MATRNQDGTLRTAMGLSIPLSLDDRQDLVQTLRKRIGPALALDASSSLVLTREEVRGNIQNLRFQQHIDGVPVYPGRLDLHIRDNILTSLESGIRRLSVLGDENGLSLSEVEARVQRRLQFISTSSLAEEWVYPVGPHQAEFAWRLVGTIPSLHEGTGGLEAADGPFPVAVFASQVDGRVLSVKALSQHASCSSELELNCTVSTTGIGDDSQSYPLEVFRGQGFPLPVLLDGYLHPYSSSNYPDLFSGAPANDLYLVDVSQEASIGRIYVIDSDGYIFKTADRQFYDQGDSFAHAPSLSDSSITGPAVSALYGIRATLEWYRDAFGRAGIDNQSGAPMDVVARVGLKGFNATWISDYHLLAFGSWAGQSTAVARDLLAHELTHGVIEFSAGLEYDGEAGALHEGLADLFGAFLESELEGEVDWWIGEDIDLRPPLRNLAHPEIYGMPGHMSDYFEGAAGGAVHHNSAIVSKAIQLAIDGTEEGVPYHSVDVQPAESDPLDASRLVSKTLYDVIMYRLAPDSTFADWAVAMLGSVHEADLEAATAERLFGSLRDSFYATGILTDENGLTRNLIAGQVTGNTSGGEIPLADILVTLTVSGTSQSTYTDSMGGYLFDVPDELYGEANILADADGYYAAGETVSLSASTSPGVVVADVVLAARPAPKLDLTLSSSPLRIPVNGVANVTVTVRNGGSTGSELTYRLTPTVSYTAKQVTLNWDDISGTSMLISLDGDQDSSDAYSLTTPFPFYLGSFSSLYVGTDGFLTLSDHTPSAYRDTSLPSSSAPSNLIAPLLCDLDFGSVDRAWLDYDTSRGTATVQFDEVPEFAGPFTYTFQATLESDGRIVFRYHTLPAAPESWARVGLQDATGLEGLEVAVLKPDEVLPFGGGTALELTPSVVPSEGRILVAGYDPGESPSGVIGSGKSVAFNLSVSGQGLKAGTGSFLLRLDTNEPGKPVTHLTVPLEVY